MADKDGTWAKIYRGTEHDNLWEGEPFCKYAAWVWMIEQANWTDGWDYSRRTHKKVFVPTGSFWTSDDSLMKAWGWSRNKVRNFIRDIIEDGKITIKRDNSGTLVNITNYAKYQGEKNSKKDSKKNSKKNSNRDTIIEDKEPTNVVKEIKEDSAPADETDPEPMRGTPEWYAWADRHDEEDGDG